MERKWQRTETVESGPVEIEKQEPEFFGLGEDLKCLHHEPDDYEDISDYAEETSQLRQR